MKRNDTVTAQVQELPRSLRVGRFLLQSLIVLVGVGGFWWAVYSYLWVQAEPFTPPLGTVFPREPVLVGTYQFINGPGGRNLITKVDDKEIFCSSFSYYSATWFNPGAYFDCGLKRELNGKPVEVHRVRIPTKNDKSHALAIKIVSDGRVYLDLSDAQIREKWIEETKEAGLLSKGLIVLIVFLGSLISYITARWSEEIFKGESA